MQIHWKGLYLTRRGACGKINKREEERSDKKYNSPRGLFDLQKKKNEASIGQLKCNCSAFDVKKNRRTSQMKNRWTAQKQFIMKYHFVPSTNYTKDKNTFFSSHVTFLSPHSHFLAPILLFFRLKYVFCPGKITKV